MPNSNSQIFPYFLGVRSLHDIVNKHSRVCVMNILGTESSKVTPVSHAYSGSNVVAGVQYGTRGEVLETPTGDIPVFGSVKEVIDAGLHFDFGVIYLPPAAVSSAVSELCAQNEGLEKVLIVTEKLSVRDSRYIRWGCQQRKVDVIGANSLGVANPWDQVRVGGALGGENPLESLKQGSIAIYSNSGNFCTTIAQYLKTSGFGTSTILSSGKDLYIQFALAEFLYCAENDPRTKAVVVYVEPGGYYEKQALDWIKENRFLFTKPIVAVVTGRWKKNLRRAVGHAGAMSGSGDDALSKEHWFDDYFGVGVFQPQKPTVSHRGVRVAGIQDVPRAVAEVLKLRGETFDFEPKGDLSLKPWFANEQGISLPSSLSLPVVKALPPYEQEIEEANKLVGAQYLRQPMRNRSGASRMNEKTQISELHGKSLLTLVSKPFASTSLFSILKELPEPNQLKVIAPLLNWFAHFGTNFAEASFAAKNNLASPNAYIASAVLSSGNHPVFQAIKGNTSKLIDLFYSDIGEKLDIKTDLIKRKLSTNPEFSTLPAAAMDENLAQFFGELIRRHGQETIFARFAQSYIENQKKNESGNANPLYLTISAILLGLCWKPLIQKQISRQDAEDLGSYLAINGIIVASTVTNHRTNKFWQELKSLTTLDVLKTDYTSTIFHILFNRDHTEQELFSFNALLNLTITNGPGTLSAMGAKGSVSARNYLTTNFAAFLTHTGFAHGGNGFEAVEFLLGVFKEQDIYKVSLDSRDAALKELAQIEASDYLQYKKEQKRKGNLQYKKIPCANHPVFKDKPVNIDPREEFIRDLFRKQGVSNPFLEFYHHLVTKLYEVGATKNVFCVNVDAVLASVSLELLWQQYKSGEVSFSEMQNIVFVVFILGRMLGSNAEISDHSNRGTDMDCRTPAVEISFVR